MSGACTPVNTRSFNAFGLYLAHQTLAALTQKSCLCVYSRPGSSFSSSPLRETQLSEKEKGHLFKDDYLVFWPLLSGHYLF